MVSLICGKFKKKKVKFIETELEKWFPEAGVGRNWERLVKGKKYYTF